MPPGACLWCFRALLFLRNGWAGLLLRRLQATYSEVWHQFKAHVYRSRLLATIGVVMEKPITVCSAEFEEQAKKTVSLAFALCERKIAMNNGKTTPELKLLSAAALSLEKVVAVLIAAERICK